MLGDTKVLYSHLAVSSVVCFARKDLQFSKLEQRDEMVSLMAKLSVGSVTEINLKTYFKVNCRENHTSSPQQRQKSGALQAVTPQASDKPVSSAP